MILICDSGSTKADWALLDGITITEFQTDGLNPVHLSDATILEKLSAEKNITTNSTTITDVFFYGAGCGSSEGKEKMVGVLRKLFTGSKITLDNDLFAAALATSGNEKGIIAILGTGSNCCFYDGSAIHLKNFGLGYILGDEASGAWFGKNFLKAYLYDKLPKKISTAFFDEYRLTREEIIESVYRKPNVNLFLSSFMPFIIKYKDELHIRDFLKNGINIFFETNVSGFSESKNATIHFVGSVAALLEIEIRETGKENNLTIGKILKRPMDGLKNYFLHQ